MDYTFRLTDAQGGVHTYSCTRHRGSEGLPLTMQIGALIIEPLAAGVGPLLLGALEAAGGTANAAKGGKGHILRSLLDSPQALASLDLPAVGRGIRTALVGLPPAAIYRVLGYTNRDGRPLAGDARATPEFDEAYAGNYGELMRAVWEVARYNGFFPELATFGDVAKRALATTPAIPANGR